MQARAGGGQAFVTRPILCADGRKHRHHLRRRRRLPRREGGRRAARRARHARRRTRRSTRSPTRSSARTPEILEANARDLEAGRANGLGAALLDRLALDHEPHRRRSPTACARSPRCPTRSARRSTATGCRTGSTCARVRVPLGVVAVVYEARPNVTIDAAALCLKSGNAIVLRGSSTAAHSNAVLAQIASEAADAGRRARRARSRSSPAAAARSCAELATQDGVVDLIIPRGGEGLKNALKAVATVPGDLRRVRQLPRLRGRRRRPRRRPRRSRSTRRSSAPASATRPRRCSCTPTSPPEFLPRALRDAARARRRAARATARTRALRRRPRRLAGRRHRGGLGDRVPRADPGGAGSSTPSRRRSSTSTATAPATPRRS